MWQMSWWSGCVNWSVWKVVRIGENIHKACACVCGLLLFTLLAPLWQSSRFFLAGGSTDGCICSWSWFYFSFLCFFLSAPGKDSSLSNLPLHLHPIYMHDLLLINVFHLTVQHYPHTSGNNNEKMHPGFAVTVRRHTSSSTDGADTVSRQMVQLSRDASASLFYFYITVMLLKDWAHSASALCCFYFCQRWFVPP